MTVQFFHGHAIHRGDIVITKGIDKPVIVITRCAHGGVIVASEMVTEYAVNKRYFLRSGKECRVYFNSPTTAISTVRNNIQFVERHDRKWGKSFVHTFR